jgi:hypothetical protein
MQAFDKAVIACFARLVGLVSGWIWAIIAILDLGF